MENIPGPTPLPLLGNVRDIEVKNTVRSLNELADSYGPIYRLTLGVANVIVVGSYELVHQILSEKRFIKYPVGTVMRMRDVIHDSLITAFHHEENWAVAHRTLIPAFGPLAVNQMFNDMHDIASQLVLKWARFGPATAVDVTADLQALALDTLALCAMDTRFNSFYRDEPHPLVNTINEILIEVTQRAARPAWLNRLQWTANRKFDQNNAFLHRFALQVIQDRRANPSTKKDLVNAMVTGRDPVTGQLLSDISIENNMIAFLIAGSETTANMLSFLFFYLLTTPDAYGKLQREIDSVVGTGLLTTEHLRKLPYTKACLREALRLQPTVPVLAVKPVDVQGPIVLGDKWELSSQNTILILLHKLHKDPSVWGDDAGQFRPERMMDENFNKLPPNAWKPFGNGQRACIGNEFAFQEATIALALLFQKFDFELADPEYKLVIRQAASIKPDRLFIHAKLRPGIVTSLLHGDLFHHHSPSTSPPEPKTIPAVFSQALDLKPMAVYYGSNMGTSRGFAEGLAQTAIQRGFKCTTSGLDEAVSKIQPGVITVIISSTYDGQPTNNASRFMEWISTLEEGSLAGVEFAVFGCGNREWKNTFQRVPNTIQDLLEQHGARPIAPKGSADAAEGDVWSQFQAWQTSQLWPSIAKLHGVSVSDESSFLQVQVVNKIPAPALSSQAAVQARVTALEKLTASEDRQKYHMEIQLPETSDYQVGDYIEVSPTNPSLHVDRVMKALRLEDDAVLEMRCATSTTLPTEMPIRARDIFSTNIELNQPATLTQIKQLHDNCSTKQDREALAPFLAPDAADLLPQNPLKLRRPSILQLLEACPSAAVTLSLSQLVAMFPALRPRPYSISSSPLRPVSTTSSTTSSNTCTLTWTLIQYPPAHQQHLPSGRDGALSSPSFGLASQFLSGLSVGDVFPVAIKPGQASFRPPSHPASMPVIMVCAGAGFAPFRAFLQHRAALLSRDPSLRLAPALLFFGCRTPGEVLYRAELEALSSSRKTGGGAVVTCYYAFSRQTADSEGCRYAQHRLWRERDEVMSLWRRGAKMYVCGARVVNEGVQDVMKRMYRESRERAAGRRLKEEEVEGWWVGERRDRYAVDVF